ncbi:hypothetical protein BDN72DRAFT_776821, partial [Pluteus cervinus]
VTEYSEPHCWRLTRNAAGSELEEGVFSLQGVIASKDLPPMIDASSASKRSAPFLRQQVTLTGFSLPTFEKALDYAGEVYNKFRRYFPDKQLQPWVLPPCSESPGRTITFSNRYFTRRNEAPTLRSIPFPLVVDPKSILANLVDGTMFHSEDNEVSYYERYQEEDKSLKHQYIPPQSFRIGDIVDIQFSFVAYRMRSGMHILKPIIYSISLVDKKYSDVCLPCYC